MCFSTYHVLGERLAEENLVALLDEVADSEGITVGITAGKALVGHVEEGNVAEFLEDLGELSPLVLAGVNTGGVVSAGVEQDGAAGGSVLEVFNQSIEVEANGLLVVVAVVDRGDASILEDGLVVGPGRSGNADLLLAAVPALEELGTDTESTSSRNGLGDGKPVEDGGVGTVGELDGGLGELGDTGDAGVLLVQRLGEETLLSLDDGGENVGLASVITVSTNT